MMVWNPPWLMLLLLPIGLLSFKSAAYAWLFINFIIIGLSLYTSWTFVNRFINEKSFLFLLGFSLTFYPTLILLYLGQISTIILFSLLMFIVLVESNRDTLAGMVLLMTTIKPHVTYLVLLVIMIWVIKNKRWRVAISATTAAIVSIVAILLINPTWIRDYISTLNSLPYNYLSTSTLGSFMNDVFGIQIFRYSFLVLLPMIFPLVTAVEKIGFFTTFNFTLLLSIPLSPYGFAFDHVLLLPAIAQIVARLSMDDGLRGTRLLAAGGLATIYIVNIWLISHKVLYSYYFWMPLALLLIFLLTINITETATSEVAIT
jgi:hypothetical protein